MSATMTLHERGLVESIGMRPGRVVSRWPFPIVVERGSSFPPVVVGLLAFTLAYHQGVLSACASGAVAAAAICLIVIAHEAGHLLLSRRAAGVTPRLLVLRPTGGVSILEGQLKDAHGAAMFAAGGPLASLLVVGMCALGGLVAPAMFSTGLFLAAGLGGALLALNLLPVAPSDGYLLFRAALWHSIGSRAKAEERAIVWSRCVLACALICSLAVLHADRRDALVMLMIVATLILQHHAVWRRGHKPPDARASLGGGADAPSGADDPRAPSRRR